MFEEKIHLLTPTPYLPYFYATKTTHETPNTMHVKAQAIETEQKENGKEVALLTIPFSYP